MTSSGSAVVSADTEQQGSQAASSRRQCDSSGNAGPQNSPDAPLSAFPVPAAPQPPAEALTVTRAMECCDRGGLCIRRTSFGLFWGRGGI